MASGHPGYIWTVYPRNSDEPMVSIGHSEREQTARDRVESELTTVDNSAWGVVIGPGVGDRRTVERPTTHLGRSRAARWPNYPSATVERPSTRFSALCGHSRQRASRFAGLAEDRQSVLPSMRSANATAPSVQLPAFAERAPEPSDLPRARRTASG